MDVVKEAFQKVKQDMGLMKQEIDFLKKTLEETRNQMIEICEILKKINEKDPEKTSKPASTHPFPTPTLSTHPSTHNMSFKPLKHQNIGISTGNQGVPTDRQTNQQTDRQTQNQLKISEKITEDFSQDSIENAAEILESLDTLKKEIRLKFKRLTEQEMLIFSTLYQLDEEHGHTDYKTLSNKLNLTESSIRDYIGRLIKKGIPVDKVKINNKNIELRISRNLKKIASLHTILQLRGL
ncbi:hypothetical protein BMS3Abin17_01036 [archaeon BMS3Abin17]|nr:hypothetical protein BMS3Abin17_01036 [archaeon BMS3Abin17]